MEGGHNKSCQKKSKIMVPLTSLTSRSIFVLLEKRGTAVKDAKKKEG